MLKGKKILVAVCGSIAAYKTAFFVRLLVKEGAEVRVIMTKSATDFITPLTLSTVSKNPVCVEYFDKATGEWTNHVELGMWPDVMVIAPLSANTLGKMANGICDNLLLATYLSAKCPVMAAPAMDLDMYTHKSTQDNLDKLRSYGNEVLDANTGELASGLVGQGRMAEPEEIVSHLQQWFSRTSRLKGKRVLITSGPTFEPIDPVRFIGNRSSGKMGTAIAEACMDEGAEVTVVSGPAQYFPSHARIIHVESAQEMYEATKSHHDKADIVVFTAAVADYRAKAPKTEKIKKADEQLELTLEKNPDIARELGKVKQKHQFHVGFALETNHEEVYAREKLKKKNFDLIVLNSLQDAEAGFQKDTNKVTFFDKDDKTMKFDAKSKKEVARDIVDYISNHTV